MDLNTTGHLAVLAEPMTGFVLRLGKTESLLSHPPERHVRTGSGHRLVKLRNRLRALEKEICLKVSREIVRVARRLACGIKFERLFSHRVPNGKGGAASSFLRVQRMVEARARRAGVAVLYVDPTATSKRCHRCGAIGRRHRKRFECPVCGLVAHADVNAAINIASAPCRHPEEIRTSSSRRNLRRRVRGGAGIRTTFEGLPAFLDGHICWSDGATGLPPSGRIPGSGR